MLNPKHKKKKSRKEITVSNGIKLSSDIQFYTEKNHNRINSFLFPFLMAFFCAYSTVILTISFVPLEISLISLFVFTFISTLMFSVVKSSKRFLSFSGFFCAAFVMIFILINRENMVNGFFIFMDKYLTLANQPSTFYGSYISDLSAAEKEKGISFLFLTISAIVSFGTTAACVYRRDFCILFIFTFPFFVLGMYWGWEPNIAAAAGIVICWAILLSLNIINHSTNKAGQKNTFAIHRSSRTFFFTSHSKKSAFYNVAGSFVALLCTAVFVLTIIFSEATGFVRPDSFDYYRKTISKATENLANHSTSEKSDSENVKESFGFFGIKSVGGTNGGILGQSKGISFNGSTALEISMPAFRYPMYLKGYSGGEYKNNTWNAIEIDENSPAYTSIRNDGFYPQDITYLGIKSILPESRYKAKKQKIRIKVKGASTQFAYAPYGTNFSGSNKGKNLKMCEESYIVPDVQKYELTYTNLDEFFGNFPDWRNFPDIFLTEKDLLGIQDNYPEYSDFVRKNYLKTTNSKALQKAYDTIVKEYLTPARTNNIDNADNYEEETDYYEIPEDENIQEFSYSDVYSAIQQYFSDNFEYTLTPGKTPEGEDFIDYFLTKQKKGYCSYFATAGTELLRKFGYPARYCEGYIVLPDQYNDGTIEVKDDSAHAWTEVYFEGLGWVPAEFTPGYDNDNPNLNLTEKKEDESSDNAESSEADISSSSKTSQTTAASSSENSKENSSSEKKDTSHKSSSETKETSSAVYSQTENHKENKSPPLALILTVFVLIIAVSTILLRRKIILGRKNNEIHQKNFSEGVKAVYRYTLDYLSLLEIDVKKNLTDKQLFEDIITQCENKNIEIDKDKLHLIFENAVKSDMSHNSTDENDFRNSEKASEYILNEVVMPDLSIYRKCKAMFIDCLF